MNKLLILISFAFLLSGFNSSNFQKENSDFLKVMKGYEIEIVAPASGKDKEIIHQLENIIGLNLVLPKHCFSSPEYFHSASDKVRLQCLKEALYDKPSKIIWTLRGGYGSPKLITELLKLPKPESEKFFIGYSDNTVLHLFFTQQWGWKTIHGAGIAEILEGNKARENFIKVANIVTGETKQAVIKGLKSLNKKALEISEVNGSLTGGNLSMVITTIGTPWQIITKNKILFLEDVGIKPYELDRTLYHLKYTGLLDEVKAIIFGEFNDQAEKNLKVLQDFANALSVPVFKTNRFGHGKYNDPIVYNVDSHIILKDNKTYDLIMKLR